MVKGVAIPSEEVSKGIWVREGSDSFAQPLKSGSTLCASVRDSAIDMHVTLGEAGGRTTNLNQRRSV